MQILHYKIDAAHLAVFVCVFAILGLAFLFRGFAATPSPNVAVGDLNNDGKVDIFDLSLLLGSYNTAAVAADVNGDGQVNILDLSILLSKYGTTVSAPPAGCTSVISTSSNLQSIIDAARPGDVLCLQPDGIYNTALTLQRSSGNSSSPITITSQDKTRPATINGRIVTKPGADYFTISWLKLNGENANKYPSPTIGSEHISLLYNDITNNHTAICVNDIDDPVYGTAKYTVIDHNRIHGCGILPPANHDHGIYEVGYYARITNNYIYDNADRGIQLRGAQGALVQYNIVDGNGQGIIFGDLGASNNTVDRNIFSNSTVRFNVESYWGGGAEGTNNAFSNNCVWSTVSGYYGSNQSIQPGISGVTMSNTIFANPLFTNPSARDYGLPANSPCKAMEPR